MLVSLPSGIGTRRVEDTTVKVADLRTEHILGISLLSGSQLPDWTGPGRGRCTQAIQNERTNSGLTLVRFFRPTGNVLTHWMQRVIPSVPDSQPAKPLPALSEPMPIDRSLPES